MSYVLTIKGEKRRYDSLDAARKVAGAIFTETGVVVGIDAEVDPVFKFRESDPPGYVILYKDDVEVLREREWRGAVQRAQRNYGLPDWHVLELYADYKTDGEERGVL